MPIIILTSILSVTLFIMPLHCTSYYRTQSVRIEIEDVVTSRATNQIPESS